MSASGWWGVWVDSAVGEPGIANRRSRVQFGAESVRGKEGLRSRSCVVSLDSKSGQKWKVVRADAKKTPHLSQKCTICLNSELMT